MRILLKKKTRDHFSLGRPFPVAQIITDELLQQQFFDTPYKWNKTNTRKQASTQSIFPKVLVQTHQYKCHVALCTNID